MSKEALVNTILNTDKEIESLERKLKARQIWRRELLERLAEITRETKKGEP